MKTITIIKTAEYDPTMNGQHSFYQGYCLSTLQVSQPHINSVEHPSISLQVKSVFCSTLTRSQETAQFFIERPMPSKLLDEIRVDLSKLLSEDEFKTFGSSKVRERFLVAFAQDKLLESRADVFTRIRMLLSYLRSKSQSDLLCVSHSFFMKVLEAYIRTDGAIEKHPELLSGFISLEKHTYPYMEGFKFKL